MEKDALLATSRSNGLLAVYERFKHQDFVLRGCKDADDPIYRTCAALWIAVEEAQVEPVVRPHSMVIATDESGARVGQCAG